MNMRYITALHVVELALHHFMSDKPLVPSLHCTKLPNSRFSWPHSQGPGLCTAHLSPADFPGLAEQHNTMVATGFSNPLLGLSKHPATPKDPQTWTDIWLQFHQAFLSTRINPAHTSIFKSQRKFDPVLKDTDYSENREKTQPILDTSIQVEK